LKKSSYLFNNTVNITIIIRITTKISIPKITV